LAKKKNNQEVLLTPSGHEVDRQLTRVPIKVSPSLQALIANQLELIEMLEGTRPLNKVFLEQHRLEMLQVEGEIEVSFIKYVKMKEAAREKRLSQKRAAGEVLVNFEEAANQPEQENRPTAGRTPAERPAGYFAGPEAGSDREVTKLAQEDDLDALADQLSPGLPSAKDDVPPKMAAERKTAINVRRIALGASIKALQTFLGRELTEAEMRAIEAQVDSYLPASEKE